MKIPEQLFFVKNVGLKVFIGMIVGPSACIGSIYLLKLFIKNETLASIATLMVVVGVVTVYILFSYNIHKNLKKLKDAFNNASSGDLRVRLNIDTKDEFQEIAQYYNKMMNNFEESFSQVKTSSEMILTNTETMNAMAEEMSNGVNLISEEMSNISVYTNEQARLAEESFQKTSSLSQLLDDINANTSNMHQAVQNSTELSHKGLSELHLLAKSTEQTHVSTNQFLEAVREMGNKMREMQGMIGIISKITDQTNLLSLNASIESARAGEYGRGFSVVAQEIRQLADQSKNASIEIEETIASLRQAVDAVVDRTSNTAFLIQEQAEKTKSTQQIFDDIIASLDNIQTKSQEVMGYVEDSIYLKNDVDSSTKTVAEHSINIDASTQEVTASSEQVSSSVEELRNFAKSLKDCSDDLERSTNLFIINQ